MEGSSREGDLFTVKHELKNGKLAGSRYNSMLWISFDIYVLETRVGARKMLAGLA